MKRIFKNTLVLFMLSVMLICSAVIGTSSFSGSTHEFSTLNGIGLFKEHFKDVFNLLYDDKFESQLKIFCTKPDEDEIEGAFKCHFYNPATGKNFRGEDDSALKRFVDHYNSAVALYKADNKFGAYEQLGRALHFLEDMNTPVHTNNQSFLDSAFDSLFHMAFEKKCVKLQEKATVTLTLREFDYYKNNDIEQIGKACAILANDNFYAMYKKILSKDEVAIKSVENAQKAVAGIIYKFSLDVNS